MNFTHLDLFSGIGGFALAAKYAGVNTIQFCEKDDFCRKILAKNFPNIPIHPDIFNLLSTCKEIGEFINLHGNPWLLTAGFPCQDISNAITSQDVGPQGLKGAKSSLWYEAERIIKSTKPTIIILENVSAVRVRGADQVISSLEELNYAVWPFVVGSENVGGQIARKRAWFIAIQKPECERLEGNVLQEMAKPLTRTRGPNSYIAGPNWGRATSKLRGATNGVPGWVDRLKSLGNALTPEIPYAIISNIKKLYGNR